MYIICNGDSLALTLTFDLCWDCSGQSIWIRQEKWCSWGSRQSDGGGHRRRVSRRGFERARPRRVRAERHHPLWHRCKSPFCCSHSPTIRPPPSNSGVTFNVFFFTFSLCVFLLQVLGYYNRNNINTQNLIKEIQSIASLPTEKFFFNVSEEAALSTIAGTLGNRIFNIEGPCHFVIF